MWVLESTRYELSLTPNLPDVSPGGIVYILRGVALGIRWEMLYKL